MTMCALARRLRGIISAFLVCQLGALLLTREALGAPILTEVKPTAASEGSLLELSGENFECIDGKEFKGKVIFSRKGTEEAATVRSCSPTTIVVQVPELERGPYVITVEDAQRQRSRSRDFFLLESVVARAIGMKKAGMSTAAIVSIFDVEGVFVRLKGRILTSEEVKALRDAGFEDDFIEKLALVPSYVTVGPAVIWLANANEVVGAGLVRIYIPPRNFLERRKPVSLLPMFLQGWGSKDKDEETLWFLNPKAVVDRFDLNFGMTTNAGTEDNVKAAPFFLLGGSYELNRYSLLNLGIAFTTEGDFSDNVQFYFGFTVDSNILKELGIISK
jgi:hypothetical protein